MTDSPTSNTPEPDATPDAGSETVHVGIERSVRFGRLLAVGAVMGAVILSLITMMQPIEEDAMYEMWQVVGFMALVGAVAGLLLGALVSLTLAFVTRKSQGTGVAVHTDVQ